MKTIMPQSDPNAEFFIPLYPPSLDSDSRLTCPTCGEQANLYPPSFEPAPGQGDRWQCGECGTFVAVGERTYGY